MVEPTQNERSPEVDGLAAAARDRGMEQLEGAKGQLAEGAERVAAAVERTADELGGDGALSGFGHSVASLMRQLAGGLRERDIEEFSRELAALARRNPGVFLAGSVALGFGIARFFKARAPHAADRRDGRWQDSGGRNAAQSSSDPREDFDGDESLDLSAGSSRRDASADESEGNGAGGNASQHDAEADHGDAVRDTETDAATPDDDERGEARARSPGKQSKRGGKS